MERDGRHLALKVLHGRHGASAEETLRREIALGPLVSDHPGVVAVRHVETIDGTLHLEMELVRGPSLARVIAGRNQSGRGPIPPSVAGAWIADVLRTLHDLAHRVDPGHRHGFVHRDLKPANLLLDPTGRVRVTDFGIAKAQAELGFQTTQEGVVKGSPRYMAPELLLERSVDARADQFSLGAVLYELVAGAPVYEGRDLANLLLLALQADVEPRLAALSAPPAFVVVLRRLLSREPDDRYPDHLEAAEALAAATPAGPSVEALLPELLALDPSADPVDEPPGLGTMPFALDDSHDGPTQAGIVDPNEVTRPITGDLDDLTVPRADLDEVNANTVQDDTTDVGERTPQSLSPMPVAPIAPGYGSTASEAPTEILSARAIEIALSSRPPQEAAELLRAVLREEAHERPTQPIDWRRDPSATAPAKAGPRPTQREWIAVLVVIAAGFVALGVAALTLLAFG